MIPLQQMKQMVIETRNKLKAEKIENMPEEWRFGLTYLKIIFLIMLGKTLKLFIFMLLAFR